MSAIAVPVPNCSSSSRLLTVNFHSDSKASLTVQQRSVKKERKFGQWTRHSGVEIKLVFTAVLDLNLLDTC